MMAQQGGATNGLKAEECRKDWPPPRTRSEIAFQQDVAPPARLC